jgi:AcrR family transcriptional regulator
LTNVKKYFKFDQKKVAVQQKRSLESQRKLLEAAEELFAEKGFQRTTVANIIERSGCSVGSFYHQFTDKLGLFEVLFQHYVEDTCSAVDQFTYSRKTEPHVSQVLQQIGMLAVGQLKSHVGTRIAADELMFNRPDLRDAALKLTDRYIERMSGVVIIYADQIVVNQPIRALENAIQMMAMTLTFQSLRPTHHLPLEDKELVAFLVQVACSILQVGYE